jgi:hypothetical protein
MAQFLSLNESHLSSRKILELSSQNSRSQLLRLSIRATEDDLIQAPRLLVQRHGVLVAIFAEELISLGNVTK